MVKELKIENFKSLKGISLSSKKVNVFIGEPNSGKSNIIEALSLFSMSTNGVKEIIRIQNVTDLFYDNLTDHEVKISLDSLILQLQSVGGNLFALDITFETRLTRIYLDIIGNINSGFFPNFTPTRFYSYRGDTTYTNHSIGVLNPPFGDNLISIIISNSAIKGLVQDIFRSKGFRLKIKPVENQIEVSKEKNDEIFSYPYSNISETLKRIIFFITCLETSKGSILLFDEPEANTFPFYTKYFAERIAFDQTNQFFFTTHNPYLLESVVAKTAPSDLNIVIAYMENYETKLRVLNEQEVSGLMELDVFFNLKRYTGQP